MRETIFNDFYNKNNLIMIYFINLNDFFSSVDNDIASE